MFVERIQDPVTIIAKNRSLSLRLSYQPTNRVFYELIRKECGASEMIRNGLIIMDFERNTK